MHPAMPCLRAQPDRVFEPGVIAVGVCGERFFHTTADVNAIYKAS